MGVIRILEDHLVNKIAAGEVVERPASVVKELVENALDAGATRVEVRLRSGGRQLVQVVDDGSGMSRDDALMCLERHGTSKIRTEHDLFSVATLGFRGEAIPSIASISKFEIITRPASDEVGSRITVHGGRLRPPEPAGCPVGTQISAASLFFNVPVRRKFLRTVQTELGHCLEAVTRQAMIRPDVDFTVEHDGRDLIRCPAVDSRHARAADLLKAHGAALIPVVLASGDVEVEALVSPVGVHQANSAGAMYLYVNGRYVRDPTLRRAINEAYRHLVPKGRYPVVVLEVRLPPEEVDVNVHPSKIEVRFRNGRDLFRFVADGLREGLQAHGIRRPVSTAPAREREQPAEQPSVGLFAAEPAAPAPRTASPPAPAPRTASPPASAPTPAPRAAAPPAPGVPAPRPASLPAPAPRPVASLSPAPAPRPVNPSPAPRLAPVRQAPPPAPPAQTPHGPGALLPVPRFQDLRVIGQFAETYILCEGGGELIMIDQHAAHERVTLYRLQQDARERLGGAQRLLTPIIVELPVGRAELLADRLDVLADLNLEVEPYGGGAFAVSAVPPGLSNADVPALVRDIADDLAEGGAGLAGRDIMDHMLATMACHNSIRAHQALSPYEMRELLKALDAVDFEVCAHGRPVAIRVDQAELERRFHRS
ncbi:MAG: DNA mismatch repair endonuclease MutL [Alphaproteobacteria bacterium]|nr:DNA mismatch repair endonuclease MutL [Alphaproteobacteria bacterium]